MHTERDDRRGERTRRKAPDDRKGDLGRHAGHLYSEAPAARFVRSSFTPRTRMVAAVSTLDRAFKVVLIALLGLGACNTPAQRERGAHHPAATAATTSPLPAPEQARTLVEATSPDGALWALRRWSSRTGRVGPMTIMRTRDLSVVATLPVRGEPESGGTTGGRFAYAAARFCEGGRFAMLTRDGETFVATVWDLERAAPRSIATSARYTPAGWSATCELIAFGPSESRFRAGADELADVPEETRVPIRLVGPNTHQDFEVVAVKGDSADVVDVTDDAFVVVTWSNREDMRVTSSSRLVLVDRRTGRTTALSTTPSTWARQTPRSWVVVPSGKAPRIHRLDGASSSSPSSVGSPPKVFATPSGGDAAAALDAKVETLAVFDGERMSWWSLPSARRLGTQSLEPFHSPYPGRFDLSFSSDGRLMIASDDYGNVVAVRREGGIAYRHPFGIETCGRPEPCAEGNMEQVMRSVTSADRTRFAVGTDWDASDAWTQRLEAKAKRRFETTVVDLATGELHALPTRGVPVGFVGDDEKLVIGNDVWSIAERRVVGHLPR